MRKIITITLLIISLTGCGRHCYLDTAWTLITGNPETGKMMAENSKPAWPRVGHVHSAMYRHKPDYINYKIVTDIPDDICDQIEGWISEGYRVGIDYFPTFSLMSPRGKIGHSIYLTESSQCRNKEIYQLHLAWETREG